MAIDKEKQSARWLRNKQAERARARRPIRPLDPEFLDLAIAERDLRVALGRRGVGRWREAHYLSDETRERAVGFAADVWLAIIIHDFQFGSGSAKTRHIRQWLEGAGRDHGYSSASLRKLIPKARKRIRLLETLGVTPRSAEPCWPSFELNDVN